MNNTIKKLKLVQQALDILGSALADHNHKWSKKQRSLYEKATKILEDLEFDDPEKTLEIAKKVQWALMLQRDVAYTQLRDCMDTLELIQEEGGKVVDTEYGPLSCDGFWCGEQARTQLYKLKK